MERRWARVCSLAHGDQKVTEAEVHEKVMNWC